MADESQIQRKKVVNFVKNILGCKSNSALASELGVPRQRLHQYQKSQTVWGNIPDRMALYLINLIDGDEGQKSSDGKETGLNSKIINALSQECKRRGLLDDGAIAMIDAILQNPK